MMMGILFRTGLGAAPRSELISSALCTKWNWASCSDFKRTSRYFPEFSASLVNNGVCPLSFRCQSVTQQKQHGLILDHWASQLGLPAPMGLVTRDVTCTVAIFIGSYLLVRLFDLLVQKNAIEQKLSRKLIHISSGIIFALTWPMYSMSPFSRYFALAIPVTNALKLLFYGSGLLKNEGLVRSISRGGTPMELLRGPLYYVLVLSFSTIFFWRDSPVGMIALAIMCGGDGIADIVGRRMGRVKLPYNTSKSWAGSIAMFVFGFALSLGFIYYYTFLGFLKLDWQSAIPNMVLISFVATLVESLPISKWVDDNLSVPFVSVILGVALFPLSGH